ncbi:MAG: hypothetical protein KDE56_07955 [Anaerolineales bacterium]|nr:hypothetical protein [Anaerolineales bacterium]
MLTKSKARTFFAWLFEQSRRLGKAVTGASEWNDCLWCNPKAERYVMPIK